AAGRIRAFGGEFGRVGAKCVGDFADVAVFEWIIEICHKFTSFVFDRLTGDASVPDAMTRRCCGDGSRPAMKEQAARLFYSREPVPGWGGRGDRRGPCLSSSDSAGFDFVPNLVEFRE